MKYFLMTLAVTCLLAQPVFADLVSETTPALSVQPTEETTPEVALPLAEKEVPSQALSSFFDTAKSSAKEQPLIWSIIGIVLAFLGVRGGKKLYGHASAIASPGEILGMTATSAGVLAVTAAGAQFMGWNTGTMLLMAAGCLATIFGFGFSCQSYEQKQKAANESR